MGHGGGNHHIKPTGGNHLPSPLGDHKSANDAKPAKSEEQAPKHPKADASLLFNKKWNNAQAGERRNDLASKLKAHSEGGGDQSKPRQTRAERGAHLDKQLERARNPFEKQRDTPKGLLEKQAEKLGKPLEKLVEQPKRQLEKQISQTSRTLEKQAEHTNKQVEKQIEQPKNLLNQSWKDLIGAAKQHKDLESFRREPQKFWDDVRKMSELRTTETYVNGKLQPRVTSRYGDLLALLNRLADKGDKGGGGTTRLNNFINSLPNAEKNVFLARYQLNRTFGANELFAGRGIALAKDGQFPLQTFLSTHGKNQEFSPAEALSLIGGDFGAESIAALLEDGGIFTNAPLLLDAKSAALLSLSLALHQNIDALLSLEEVVPEAPLPKNANVPLALSTVPHTNGKSVSDNDEAAHLAAQLADGESFAVSALINGALATIERHAKINRQSLDMLAGVKDDAGFRFSAGATGAMMGATVGCVVPLADKSVGEILGFASSVVVGLSDSGLRSLGANALVSVITSGVQTFLNVSVAHQNILSGGGGNGDNSSENTFLNAANPADLIEAETFFSPRIDVFSPA